MKILIVADEENNSLWGNWDERWRKNLSDVNLVLSAGDLAPAYLEFIKERLNVPLMYVRGNHDSFYDSMPPKGCMNIDGKFVNYYGLKIAGLGGSMKYREGRDMYTEEEQGVRVDKIINAAKNNAGTEDYRKIDVLLTHAPCYGYGDLEDLPHTGFDCFNTLIRETRPKVHLYGHIHIDYGQIERIIQHPTGTTMINCCGLYMLELM